MVASRKYYAGLKILPEDSYRKIQKQNEETSRYETHFQCLYLAGDHTDGERKICGKSFPKSTSLIVHYQHHE